MGFNLIGSIFLKLLKYLLSDILYFKPIDKLMQPFEYIFEGNVTKVVCVKMEILNFSVNLKSEPKLIVKYLLFML